MFSMVLHMYCPVNRSGLSECVLNRQAVSDRYARTGTLSLTWKPAQVKNGVCVCVCVREQTDSLFPVTGSMNAVVQELGYHKVCSQGN